jgi:hypothetical protein
MLSTDGVQRMLYDAFMDFGIASKLQPKHNDVGDPRDKIAAYQRRCQEGEVSGCLHVAFWKAIGHDVRAPHVE